MEKAEIVNANPDLMQRFYGEPPAKTVRAKVVVRGEEILGVVGTYLDEGLTILFSDYTDELRAHYKVALLKSAKAALRTIDKRFPVISQADPEIPGSGKLLQHLGFEPLVEEIYLWRN